LKSILCIFCCVGEHLDIYPVLSVIYRVCEDVQSFVKLLLSSKLLTMVRYFSRPQALTLTFVRMSGTSENWRRTSRILDLALRLSGGTSEKIRDSQTCRYDGQIYFEYFHWYEILGLLYKRALFDLQFVHILFWLRLKWNARSKLFYCIIYRSSMLWWSSRTLTKLKSQSQKRFNERKYQYLKYKNKNHYLTDT
jgi:hypothetical protein